LDSNTQYPVADITSGLGRARKGCRYSPAIIVQTVKWDSHQYKFSQRPPCCFFKQCSEQKRL